VIGIGDLGPGGAVGGEVGVARVGEATRHASAGGRRLLTERA
jgi:hypothetical protein